MYIYNYMHIWQAARNVKITPANNYALQESCLSNLPVCDGTQQKQEGRHLSPQEFMAKGKKSYPAPEKPLCFDRSILAATKPV